jgi:hypothetical protein
LRFRYPKEPSRGAKALLANTHDGEISCKIIETSERKCAAVTVGKITKAEFKDMAADDCKHRW